MRDDTQSVVVYRSKMEQMQDEAYWNLANEHPIAFISVHVAIFAVITAFIIKPHFKHRRF